MLEDNLLHLCRRQLHISLPNILLFFFKGEHGHQTCGRDAGGLGRENTPVSHRALGDVSLFVCNGRLSHDNTCGAFAFWNSNWEFFFLFCFLICVKEKSRLLRNEVPDNVPEYSGPFLLS